MSVRIGTPLSPSATRVMLLGAGELGKEVIIALQRFGVEVIAVDRYANAPGQQVAHRRCEAALGLDQPDGAQIPRTCQAFAQGSRASLAETSVGRDRAFQ